METHFLWKKERENKLLYIQNYYIILIIEKIIWEMATPLVER